MSSDNERNVMSDEQAAEHYYRHRDEIEREPGEPVDIEPARLLSLVVSVRLRADEAEQVAAASKSSGHENLHVHSASRGGRSQSR